MTIVEFFNIYNVEHLLAFRYLEREGVWPTGFLPADVRFYPGAWKQMLESKMSTAWYEHALLGKIEGIPQLLDHV